MERSTPRSTASASRSCTPPTEAPPPEQPGAPVPSISRRSLLLGSAAGALSLAGLSACSTPTEGGQRHIGKRAPGRGSSSRCGPGHPQRHALPKGDHGRSRWRRGGDLGLRRVAARSADPCNGRRPVAGERGQRPAGGHQRPLARCRAAQRHGRRAWHDAGPSVPAGDSCTSSPRPTPARTSTIPTAESSSTGACTACSSSKTPRSRVTTTSSGSSSSTTGSTEPAAPPMTSSPASGPTGERHRTVWVTGAWAAWVTGPWVWVAWGRPCPLRSWVERVTWCTRTTS